MKIQRKRYVVMRNNRTEIFVYGARYTFFKPVNDVGNFGIKTYVYAEEAKSDCFGFADDFEVVPIVETFESAEE